MTAPTTCFVIAVAAWMGSVSRIMRSNYYARFALVIALQTILIVSFFFSPSEAVTPIVVGGGFLLPFIGYLLAFYRPAVAAGWSRIAFIFLIVFATVIGFFVLLFLTFLLLMTFGGHHL
jgi:hypothetical protein